MQPPKRALAFLRWFCREDYLEEIEGDLTELFFIQSAASPRKARMIFTWSVLRYFRPAFIRFFRSRQQPDSIDMIRNYLKVGFRNLVRNNGYSVINIGGLALGMTVTIFIGLWVVDELSFNRYHKNYDSIGQLWAGGTDPETSLIDGSVALQFPMAAHLKSSYGQYFDHVLMAWWVGANTLSTDDKKMSKVGEFIEGGAPEMLSLKMIRGDYSCLRDLHSIILSESTARAFFGNDDAMNKSLKINNEIEVRVTGVYEDLPKNNTFSEVQFFSPWDLFVASNNWVKQNENSWNNRSFNIYVQLKAGITMDEANAGIHDFYYKVLPVDFMKEVEKYKPYAQIIPMNTWHLYSEFKDGKPATGRITFVWLFGIVGAFVLMLACINFINLSTARSEKRAREVGVRKSVGSGRGQLILQFLSESFLVVLCAFVLSMSLVWLSQHWFNQLSDKEIALPFGYGIFWLVMMIFILLTGLMAGLYPAFYLSSFQPVKILKGAIHAARFASLPRKILVVIQFTVSVVLIIGTIVVYEQIQYARNRPLGYSNDGLLMLPMNDPNFSGKHELIRNALIGTGVVADVAYSSNPVTAVWNNSGGYNWPGRDPEKDNDFAIMNVSYDFGKTLGWKFISGRDFSRDFSSDTAAIIINETAAKYMNLKSPVGEIVGHESMPDKWKIVGVIKDMVMESPYEPVKQTIFYLDHHYAAAGQVQIKLKSNVGVPEALSKVENVFSKIIPTTSFDYQFVDETYAFKFSQEQRIGKLSGVFACLAIFISCLGLFGLASFVAERRTKEIGIRKVLGASVTTVWRMLSKEFVLLVSLSCAIAIPVSYWLMNSWLKEFTYRTAMSWWLFTVAIAGALLVTLMTVSFHAIRAARMNPVKSLRKE